MEAWARERWASPEYQFWLSEVVRSYLGLLLEEQIRLTERLSVACVLSDFCELAGIVVPEEVEWALSLPEREALRLRVIVA
ncbi:MAG: hypothetical protein ACR2M3_19570 [Thermomicrobiales bacterium]